MMEASEDIKKSKRGRPKVSTTPLMVRVEPVLLSQLDDWRRREDDLPTRPEAIRRLIEAGLKVSINRNDESACER